MADPLLTGRIVSLAASLLILSACGVLGYEAYSEKNPREVGNRVEHLREEVVPGLRIEPSRAGRTVGSSCGDDRDQKTVKPASDDPWKVTYNHYDFVAAVTIPVSSAYDAPPIYTNLLQYLRKVGKWRIGETRTASGFLGGLQGEKEGVQLNAWDMPDGKGRHTVIVQLESDCYRHPNA